MYLSMRKKRDVLRSNARSETFTPPLPPIQVQDSFPQLSQTQKDSQFTIALKSGFSSQKVPGRLDTSKNLSKARDSQQSSFFGGLSPSLSQTVDSRRNSYSTQPVSTFSNSQLTPNSNISTQSSMAREPDTQSSSGSMLDRIYNKFMGGIKSQNSSPANKVVFKREPSFSNFGSPPNTQNSFKGREGYNPDKAEAEFVRTESHPMLTELNKNVQLLMDIVKIHFENCNEPKEKLNENVCEISKMIIENKSGENKTKEILDKLNGKIEELAVSLQQNAKCKDLSKLESNMSKLLTLIDTVIKNQKLNHFNYITSRSENNAYKIKQMEFFNAAQKESDVKMEKRMNFLENELTNISSMIKTLIKDEKLFNSQQQILKNPNTKREKIDKNENGFSDIDFQHKIPRRKLMVKICPPKDLAPRRQALRRNARVPNDEIPPKKKKVFLVYPSDTDDALHLPLQNYAPNNFFSQSYDEYFW